MRAVTSVNPASKGITMSWSIILRSSENTMGPKQEVRERFLSACEQITGKHVPRRGPTEVEIDPSFNYEVLMGGQKWAVDTIILSIHITDGDPQLDSSHPVWSFLRKLHVRTGWNVIDTHTGDELQFVSE